MQTTISLINAFNPMKTKIKVASLGLLILTLGACETEVADPNYELRDEYVGSWNCVEQNSQLGTSTYQVVISKDPSDSAFILIENFHNLSNAARVRVFNNQLSIPPQFINSTDSVFGQGTATADYDQFSLDYTVDDGANLEEVEANYSPL